MTNYKQWESLEVDVTALSLDPLNPRLPEADHILTEREIIAALIEHEDVYELARQIASQGYYPTEIPVCIEENGEFYVIEGNRRVASLKLLISPSLAPDNKVTSFRKLASKATGIPSQLVISKAPSRQDTVPLVMNRHNRQGVKGWGPAQQSKYVISLRQSGMSIEGLAEATGFTSSEILGFIRTHTMYEIATRLPVDAKAKKVVDDPRLFNISALERVIGSKAMREFLGISFDKEGGVVGHVPAKEFKRAFTRIVQDIATRQVDTRHLNNAKDFDSYIGRLQSVAPDLGKSGSFTSADFLKSSPVKTSLGAGKTSAEKRIRVQHALIPKTFKSQLGMHRINEILRELQSLRVSGFENAVAVELRIFIELAICHYLDSTNKMEPLIARLDKKKTKPKDWTPTLRQMLNELLTNDPDINIPRQAHRTLAKAISDDNWPLSLDGMDQFAHNPYTTPTERQLRQYWNSFEKLMEYLMSEHTPTARP